MFTGDQRPATSPSGEPCRVNCVRETLSARQRLRRSADFRQAYDQNRRWHGRHMVLFLRSAPDGCLRLGVVASKRVGNAVERARAKRRLRELFRRHRACLAADQTDVILVARKSILGADWAELQKELAKLTRQAGLLQSSDS